MFYCFNRDENLFREEAEYAKELNLYLYYDDLNNLFFDKNNDIVNIENLLIFPRSGISNSKDLVNAIYNHKGISIVKKDDFDKVLNWPYYIDTVRKTIVLSGEEIINNPDLIIKLFGNGKIFFKTKEKNFSAVIDISSITGNDIRYMKTLEKHKNEDFIISEAIDIESSEYGPFEFRAFVVDNKVLNVSRITRSLLETTPSDVITKLNEIADKLRDTDFPDSYVVDLVIYRDSSSERVVDILEFNPIIASGTYLYNSVFLGNENLEKSSLSNILPIEKRNYGNIRFCFQSRNRTVSSVFYNLPRGFAADLMSNSLLNSENNSDIAEAVTEKEVSAVKKLSRSK